jgi:hypothetical protein
MDKPKIYNGFFTIENTVAGTHRTFRIQTVRDNKNKKDKSLVGKRIIALLIGSDNTRNYKNFGFVDDNGIYVWGKCKGGQFEALSRCFWSMATEGENSRFYRVGARMKESRNCIRCNRLLTDPQSISLGIGPECIKRGLH